jgi:hypothetical protein
VKTVPLNALELRLLLRNLRESDAAKTELGHQKKMKREISKLSAGKEKDLEEAGLFGASEEGGEEDKESGGDDAADEESSDKDSGEEKPKEDKPKTKSDKLPGAKKLAAASKEPDEEIKSDDVIARLNFIRAGKSLKDKEVSSQLKKYIDTMNPDERKAFFAFSDGIAKIVLGGEKAVEVPSPLDTYSIKISSAGADRTPSSGSSTNKNVAPKPKQQATVGSTPPIVVGEGVKTKIKEVDVPVRSGRVVPFGSKAHIADIEDRIDDIERIRSYQEPGSESRHALSLALKALKVQLRSAYKRSMVAGNPRVTGVPPLVEKD